VILLRESRVEALVNAARSEGKEIVVVMGVGFVGAVMAAIVADTVDTDGKPSKFVIGCQRPSSRSFWKIPMLNRGQSPVKAEDPEVDKIIHRCVKEKKTLTASFNSDVLEFADVVVVDVQCDFSKQDLGYMKSGEADMAALEATLRTIGTKIQPNCLTLIETTVAPGTTEFVAWPILKKAFTKRGIDAVPLLAHSFERVMPGREYVSSIRISGDVVPEEKPKPVAGWIKYLHDVLKTKDYPYNRP
jgi:UDP-N-acetyl-D-mannosaminuronate dehydrogenase